MIVMMMARTTVAERFEPIRFHGGTPD